MTPDQPIDPPMAGRRIDAVEVFDVCGPLPTGTIVLEASAGTGKTTTIAPLAARYVAEGVAELPELMLVTFGRAATSELRDRVRERLVAVERALRDPEARAQRRTTWSAPGRRGRRRAGGARGDGWPRALAEFDAAAITTTHGFCQQMLTSLGTIGDVDPDAVLVPDVADLEAEVVDDLYLRTFAAQPAPSLSVADARRSPAPRSATRRPRSSRATRHRTPPPGHRYAFARDVVARGAPPQAGPARARLRRPARAAARRARRRADPDRPPPDGSASRYRIVLVDEFQDTDPVQWQILRTAFHGHRTLVLIGDPKQAIYAFRGADVVTYLAARASADHAATLGRNWRSDDPLLRALEPSWRAPRSATPRSSSARSRPPTSSAGWTAALPLRLRQVTRAAVGFSGTKTPPVGPGPRADRPGRRRGGRPRSSSRPGCADGDGLAAAAAGGHRRADARNADAALVRQAPGRRRRPRGHLGAVQRVRHPGGAGLAHPAARRRAAGARRAAAALALTPVRRLGRVPAGERLRRRARRAVRPAALVVAGAHRPWRRRAARGHRRGRPARAADAHDDGERTLTDLRHVGEALHVAAVQDRLGGAALIEWLRGRVDEAAADYAEERSRRLETDAAAVQVITVHASKGLQFPVVYVPFGWDRYEATNPAVLRYHDDDGQRLLHVGGTQDQHYDDARDRHLAEERGEDLRLLYVALTRASRRSSPGGRRRATPAADRSPGCCWATGRPGSSHRTA